MKLLNLPQIAVEAAALSDLNFELQASGAETKSWLVEYHYCSMVDGPKPRKVAKKKDQMVNLAFFNKRFWKLKRGCQSFVLHRDFEQKSNICIKYYMKC